MNAMVRTTLILFSTCERHTYIYQANTHVSGNHCLFFSKSISWGLLNAWHALRCLFNDTGSMVTLDFAFITLCCHRLRMHVDHSNTVEPITDGSMD
jgi:hypothetical protein